MARSVCCSVYQAVLIAKQILFVPASPLLEFPFATLIQASAKIFRLHVKQSSKVSKSHCQMYMY
jgi:hypothetical protein